MSSVSSVGYANSVNVRKYDVQKNMPATASYSSSLAFRGISAKTAKSSAKTMPVLLAAILGFFGIKTAEGAKEAKAQKRLNPEPLSTDTYSYESKPGEHHMIAKNLNRAAEYRRLASEKAGQRGWVYDLDGDPVMEVDYREYYLSKAKEAERWAQYYIEQDELFEKNPAAYFKW